MAQVSGGWRCSGMAPSPRTMSRTSMQKEEKPWRFRREVRAPIKAIVHRRHMWGEMQEADAAEKGAVQCQSQPRCNRSLCSRNPQQYPGCIHVPAAQPRSTAIYRQSIDSTPHRKGSELLWTPTKARCQFSIRVAVIKSGSTVPQFRPRFCAFV